MRPDASNLEICAKKILEKLFNGQTRSELHSEVVKVLREILYDNRVINVRIRPGVTVGQDFGWFSWPGRYEDKIDQIFTIDHQDGKLLKLKAHGFGILGGDYSYGAGALHVKIEDVILVL